MSRSESDEKALAKVLRISLAELDELLCWEMGVPVAKAVYRRARWNGYMRKYQRCWASEEMLAQMQQEAQALRQLWN